LQPLLKYCSAFHRWHSRHKDNVVGHQTQDHINSLLRNATTQQLFRFVFCLLEI
jgi:hypothetical protein